MDNLLSKPVAGGTLEEGTTSGETNSSPQQAGDQAIGGPSSSEGMILEALSASMESIILEDEPILAAPKEGVALSGKEGEGRIEGSPKKFQPGPTFLDGKGEWKTKTSRRKRRRNLEADKPTGSNASKLRERGPSMAGTSKSTMTSGAQEGARGGKRRGGGKRKRIAAYKYKTAGAGGSNSATVPGKRQREEGGTPPSSKQPPKKPRTEEERALQVAITSMDGKPLDEKEDVPVIRRNLILQIRRATLEEDRLGICITKFGLVDEGWFLLTCEDEATAEWILNLKTEWEGKSFRVMRAKDVVKAARVSTFIPKSEVAMTPEMEVTLLGKQNRMPVEKWRVLHARSDGRGTFYVLEIDDESVEILINRQCRLAFELTHVTMRVREEDRERVLARRKREAEQVQPAPEGEASTSKKEEAAES